VRVSRELGGLLGDSGPLALAHGAKLGDAGVMAESDHSFEDQTGELPLSAPAGLSVWEHKVFEEVLSHIDEEREVLEVYAEAVSTTSSKAARFLMELILNDEQRHHKLLRDLAETIAAFPLEGPVPFLDYKPNPALQKAARDLLSVERADLDGLHELKKELRPVAETSLWSLLVELLVRDTEKHIEILKFLERHASGTRG
jgi:rubrerythrin